MTTIIKLTELCNLACPYCYINYVDRMGNKYGQISLDTLRVVFRRAFASDRERVGFVFHGGEPLITGPQFFRSMMQVQKEERDLQSRKVQVWNGIQTNGTLITEEWIEIFKENDIDIGISLDYPKEYHDHARLTKKGEPTFEVIVKNVQLLKAAGIDNVGIITVLTQRNVSGVAQMYSFFKELGVAFRPNVYFPESYELGDNLVISPKMLGNALITLFDLWFEDDVPVCIDLFEDIVESMILGQSRACTFLGHCNEFLSIRPNGDVFICDRFVTDDFRAGNIVRHCLEDIRGSSVAVAFQNRAAQLSECCKCCWYEICKGGCPSYSYSFFGTIAEKDFYCDARKMLFSHIYQKLQQEVIHEKDDHAG